jgi:hypothetical protein
VALQEETRWTSFTCFRAPIWSRCKEARSRNLEKGDVKKPEVVTLKRVMAEEDGDEDYDSGGAGS